MFASVLWTIFFTLTIFATIVTLANIRDDVPLDDFVELGLFFFTALGWAIIIIFYFN